MWVLKEKEDGLFKLLLFSYETGILIRKWDGCSDSLAVFLFTLVSLYSS